MLEPTSIKIGTAGWQIPGEHKDTFPAQGSHLERYAEVFGAVEINSSFHRPHTVTTYKKWAGAVPPSFRFAVKVPKEITHLRKLQETDRNLDVFLAQIAGLGSKLGPLLVQLPPSLAFVSETAERFFCEVRHRFSGLVACEARHASWFQQEAEQLLVKYRVGRVAADPAVVDQARRPGGWPSLVYKRLHGSPRTYYSSYSGEAIFASLNLLLAGALEGYECWCIFDNTAAGAATQNALLARYQLIDIVAHARIQ